MGRKHKLKVKGRFSFLMFSLSLSLYLSLLDVVILPHLDDVQGWFRVDDFLRDELGDGDSGSWVMTKKLRLEKEGPGAYGIHSSFMIVSSWNKMMLNPVFFENQLFWWLIVNEAQTKGWWFIKELTQCLAGF